MPKQQMTYSEKRRYDTKSVYQKKRQQEIYKMTNKEVRNENNKSISGKVADRSILIQQGKFISDALKLYIVGDEEKFNRYSDRIKKLVQTIYENALKGNSSVLQEALNRLEGKVRDEIYIDHTISQHIPAQVHKMEEIRQKYRENQILIDKNNQIEENPVQDQPGDVLDAQKVLNHYQVLSPCLSNPEQTEKE